MEIKPKRCEMSCCTRKLTLCDYSCKCSKFFCVAHRHFTDHDCTFDFKTNGQKQLEKQLPKITGEKVDKI
jgi:hypothetical protein